MNVILRHRVVVIFQNTLEVGAHVVGVYMFSRLNLCGSAADDLAVFNDVFTLMDGA